MNTSSFESRPRIERIEGDVMAVNSYLVHGPSGLVVVDGQLTMPDADKVRRAVEAAAAPVAALVVTHPHPDHYAGAARLLDGLDAPIVATGAVDAVIRRDDAVKAAIVGPMMGDAWPDDRRFPDVIVESGATVDYGGLRFTVRDVGPAESDADSLWVLDGTTVFAGDVAYSGMHAFLADGRATEWLAVLDGLDNDLDDDVRLYVGHGEPGGKQLLRAQRDYVEAFVAAVTAAADLDPAARHDAVTARMGELVADDRLQFLMELSIEPVHAALTAERAT
jgi:glyoxylase-like metal-dependent hydrolase (beta-lactamase superfamily II)